MGCPQSGTVFLSLNDNDKPAGLVVARRMRERGLGLVATKGTAEYLASFGVQVDQVLGKVQDADGGRTAVDLIADGIDRVRRQHPAGLDGPHRRRAHPQGGQPAPRRLRHHRERRPGRRPGPRRITRAAPGQEPPGVSRPMTRRCPGPGRIGRARQPDHDRLGHRRVRRRVRRLLRPGLDRSGRHQVDRRLRVGRQSRPAGARHAAGDDQRRRTAGPRRRQRGSITTCRNSLRTRRDRGVQHLGPIGGRVRGRPPTCSPLLRPRSWRSRSTCRARISRGAAASSPTTPRCRRR